MKVCRCRRDGQSVLALDLAQELREAGILVEDSPELQRVLGDYPCMVTLLCGVGAMILDRLPMAKLLLRWYVDPEVSGDEYPTLVVRLPSYEDDQEFRRLLEVIRDANLVLAASPEWVLATSDFEVA